MSYMWLGIRLSGGRLRVASRFFSFPSRMITLTVHSSLDAVGLLAAVTQVLAQADISVNVVSAFYHDHLFISEHRAVEALQILSALSEQATQ